MLSNLMPVIGQFPYLSPSVFNFYLPDFKPSDFPEGKVGEGCVKKDLPLSGFVPNK